MVNSIAQNGVLIWFTVIAHSIQLQSKKWLFIMFTNKILFIGITNILTFCYDASSVTTLLAQLSKHSVITCAFWFSFYINNFLYVFFSSVFRCLYCKILSSSCLLSLESRRKIIVFQLLFSLKKTPITHIRHFTNNLWFYF